MRSSWGGANERPIAGEGEDRKERQAWRREKGRHGGHRRTSSLQLARVLGWEHQESSRKTTLWPSGWMRSRTDAWSFTQMMMTWKIILPTLPSSFIPYQHLTEVGGDDPMSVWMDEIFLQASQGVGLSFFNRVSSSGFRMSTCYCGLWCDQLEPWGGSARLDLLACMDSDCKRFTRLLVVIVRIFCDCSRVGCGLILIWNSWGVGAEKWM